MSGQDSLFPEIDSAAERAAEFARNQAAEAADRIRKAADVRDGLVSRSSSTDTQRAGAKAVAPRSGTRRSKVYQAVASAGERGVTDWELESILSDRHPNERWSYGDYAPRRRELMEMGLVEDSGERRRAGDTGSPQIVWRITA